MFDFLDKGGPFMWVILTASIVSLGLIIERGYVLWYRYRLNTGQFVNQVISYLEDKKFSRAIEICNVQQGHPLAEVMKAGLMRANESDKAIQRAIESATLRVVPKVSRRIAYLSMMANVSTLLGLLGTIMGLIQAFKSVAAADAATKQDILSKGIAIAMYTTAFGLIAAIPAIVSHAILQSRQNDLLSTIESRATDLFNYLSARNRRLVGK